MKLSIIIPVYNEEKTILKLINNIKSINFPINYELIIVNDGSTDSTSEKLRKLNINLIEYKENKGKGFAVRKGLRSCKGDIIAIQDADLEYNPKQIPNLVKPILNKETEVVYGSRFLKKENQNWKIPTHYLGNRLLTSLSNLLYKCNLTDMETCYKIFTKKVKNSLNLTLNDFGLEIELTSQICKNGFKIKEIPINYYPRSWEEGKKINWKDGIKAIYYLIKCR